MIVGCHGLKVICRDYWMSQAQVELSRLLDTKCAWRAILIVVFQWLNVRYRDS